MWTIRNVRSLLKLAHAASSWTSRVKTLCNVQCSDLLLEGWQDGAWVGVDKSAQCLSCSPSSIKHTISQPQNTHEHIASQPQCTYTQTQSPSPSIHMHTHSPPSPRAHMYVHMCTCMYVCMHWVPVFARVCMCVYVCVRMCLGHVCVCVSWVCIRACMRAHMMCMYVFCGCMCMWMCICSSSSPLPHFPPFVTHQLLLYWLFCPVSQWNI